MNVSLHTILVKRIDRTIEALRANRMDACFVETRQDALEKIKSLLPSGGVVSHGGSVTLAEIGVPQLLKEGGYRYLDRAKPNLTREEIQQIYRDTFSADVFLTSTNAITERGELYNVDGNCNRVAALLFGPKSVIVVAGYNKIVANIDEAAQRVKRIAAPANAVRLDCETYCRAAGQCVSLKDGSSDICSGCGSDARICCNYVISAMQREKGRIKVILVGEPLGY